MLKKQPAKYIQPTGREHMREWSTLKAAAQKNGVIISFQFNGANASIFSAAMRYTIKRWFQILSSDVVEHSGPYIELENTNKVVCALGSFWDKAKTPKWFVPLFSETTERDANALQGIMKRRRRGFPPIFPLSHSESVAKHLTLLSNRLVSHAMWLWYDPAETLGVKHEDLQPHFVSITKTPQLVCWMTATERRIGVLGRLQATGTHINAKFDIWPTETARWIRTPNHVLLNVHAYHDRGHLEVCRLSHPCVRGMCVVTEASDDTEAESELMRRGMLHGIWDGNPRTLSKVVVDAVARHAAFSNIDPNKMWALGPPKWW